MDSSERAVRLAAENVALNFGADAPHEAVCEDTFDYLNGMDGDFDLIILDPPAFAKHHKVTPEALKGYKRLNAKAFSKIRAAEYCLLSPVRRPSAANSSVWRSFRRRPLPVAT